MQRTFLAALLGGIVMFGWGALFHTALPLGEMGYSKLPNESELIGALKTQVPEAGTYMFPDVEALPADQQPASGPWGFLAWQPETPYAMGKQLGIEFASNVLAALIAALVLCGAACGGTLLCRATTVMGMGVFAWLSIGASEWTWYGFSNGLFIANGLEQAIGWFLAGLAIAAIVKPKAAAAA